MQITFYYKFFQLLIKRKHQKTLKEIVVGSIFTIILTFLYNQNIMWGNLAVFFYSFLILIVCMVDNNQFLSFQDLKIFGVTKNNYHFKITYIIQKITQDMVFSNFIIIISLLIYFLLTAKFYMFFFFLLFIIMVQLLMPSYHYWAYKVGEQGVIVTVFLMTIVLISTILLSLYQISPFTWFFNVKSPLAIAVLIVLFLVHVFLLDLISFFITKKNSSILTTRSILLWMKRIDYLLFKDYILFFKHIISNLFMVLSLLLLILIGTESALVPFIIAFIVCSSNIITYKSKGEYNLITGDPFFSEKFIHRDQAFIRLSKLKTIITGGIIRIIIIICLLIYYGQLEAKILLPLCILSIVRSFTEYIIMYENKRIITIVNHFLIYTSILMFGIVSYFETYYSLLYIYILILTLYISYWGWKITKLKIGEV